MPADDDHSNLRLLGRGELLRLPALPLVVDPSLYVQLLSSNPAGKCLEASYTPNEVHQTTALTNVLRATY